MYIYIYRIGNWGLHNSCGSGQYKRGPPLAFSPSLYEGIKSPCSTARISHTYTHVYTYMCVRICIIRGGKGSRFFAARKVQGADICEARLEPCSPLRCPFDWQRRARVLLAVLCRRLYEPCNEKTGPSYDVRGYRPPCIDDRRTSRVRAVYREGRALGPAFEDGREMGRVAFYRELEFF